MDVGRVCWGRGVGSGHTKSREIKLLTYSAGELLSESNPAVCSFWFFFKPETVSTGCER